MIGEEKGSVAISGRSSDKMTGLLPVEASQILDHCQHVHIWCKKAKKQYTLGQRAPEFGIELSSNMAPKTEIAGRRLVASFLHYKKRLLLHAGIPQKPDGMFL